jgi:hypothetical protein
VPFGGWFLLLSVLAAKTAVALQDLAAGFIASRHPAKENFFFSHEQGKFWNEVQPDDMVEVDSTRKVVVDHPRGRNINFGRANEKEMNDGESKRDAEAEHSKDCMEMEVDSDLVLPHPNDEWEAQNAASVLVIERSLDGAPGIVALMERHPASTKVQASCCRALAMQLNRGEEAMDALEEAGAIEVVVDALQRGHAITFYPSAFFVLSNMANTTNLRRKLYVIRTGGMQEIINAINIARMKSWFSKRFLHSIR